MWLCCDYANCVNITRLMNQWMNNSFTTCVQTLLLKVKRKTVYLQYTYPIWCSIMSLMLGQSTGISAMQLLTKDNMAGHWIHRIWFCRCSGWDSGRMQRHISANNTPKLNTSILGVWYWGWADSGAAYMGEPGPAVAVSFIKLADP